MTKPDVKKEIEKFARKKLKEIVPDLAIEVE